MGHLIGHSFGDPPYNYERGEEITVVFRDPGVGRKTMLGSLANLEITG